jgi:hypothetical protein
MCQSVIDLLPLVLDLTNSSRIDLDWFWSQSRCARRREFNFGWCLLAGAPSLGSSSDALESSYRSLCLFPLSVSC